MKLGFALTSGQVAYKRQENITTLAVYNADLINGRALDRLIIFVGKNMQSTWKPKNVLPKHFL